jgi:hypothetical protein
VERDLAPAPGVLPPANLTVQVTTLGWDPL